MSIKVDNNLVREIKKADKKNNALSKIKIYGSDNINLWNSEKCRKKCLLKIQV